jgi:uncharacterized membrane protein YfcA
MDFLQYAFPISGVKTNILIPPLVALVVSFFTSMGGISGAVLLLPFQMSVLHYTSPSVSGTNLIFNTVAIPGGVYRYIKEGRMAWPLTWVVILGTLPGVFIGYFIRVLYLPDPGAFRLFVGCVLLYIGSKLLYELTGRARTGNDKSVILEDKYRERTEQRGERGLPDEAVVRTIRVSLRKIEYEFWGERFSYSTIGMLVLAFIVGIIGGVYGIGGGAIIAPFCVAVFHLPVYTIAGAALMATFITSVAGVIFYSLIPAPGGTQPMPDWLLGFLFGIGGAIGIYWGARFQKFVPQKLIKLMLGGVILFLALSYIIQYF